MTFKKQVQKPKSQIFRRMYIKRRDATTGLFETNWQEITDDVIKWGKIEKQVDDTQFNKFKFKGVTCKLSNKFGRYNPESEPASLWFGYATPQRSLLRIEAGLVDFSLAADGIWKATEYPNTLVNSTSAQDLVYQASPITSLTFVTTTNQYAVRLSIPGSNYFADGLNLALFRGASASGSLTIRLRQGTSMTTSVILTETTYNVTDMTTSATNLSVTSVQLSAFSGFKLAPVTHWIELDATNVNFTTGSTISWAVGTDPAGAYAQNSSGNWVYFGATTGAYQLKLYQQTVPSLFTGYIAGDFLQNDNNEVTIQALPLIDLFRNYPARLLSGYSAAGLTANQFIGMIRDHQDSASNYVFRPFFGDTTTGFEIAATTNVYSQLNSATAEDVIDSNVWKIVEKLSQSEQLVPNVTGDGIFQFKDRTPNTTSVQFAFTGIGSFDREYGKTIKKIKSFGPRFSKFYSRVDVKYDETDTPANNFATVESTFEVTGSNLPWLYGHRTYKLENIWIPNATVAETIAQTIFDEVSALKREIEFEATFVPNLDVLDLISVTYDNRPGTATSLWDLNDWCYTLTTYATTAAFDYTTFVTGTGFFTVNNGWWAAQKFTSGSTELLMEYIAAPVTLFGTGTTGGTVTMRIYDVASSVPGTLIAESTAYTLTTANFTTSVGTVGTWPIFQFAQETLTASTEYFAVLYMNNADGGKLQWWQDTNTYGSLYHLITTNSGTTWAPSANNRVFAMQLYGAAVASTEEVGLVWDDQEGDALKLYEEEFKIQKVTLDLDKLSTIISARET